MLSSWPLSTLDEGHELLDVEGTVSVPRHFTCWDLHGGVEADELAPLIVKPSDFDESLLADPLDIGVEVACFQAGVAEKPLLVARSAHCRRCAPCTPRSSTQSTLRNGCKAGHQGPGP